LIAEWKVGSRGGKQFSDQDKLYFNKLQKKSKSMPKSIVNKVSYFKIKTGSQIHRHRA
jgi:hypothetical protein